MLVEGKVLAAVLEPKVRLFQLFDQPRAVWAI